MTIDARGARPLRVYLVRHTETDWSRAGRYLGHTDRPLTARGRARAERLARRFSRHRFAAVISSGLRRTDHLAIRVGLARGTPDVERDPRWREVDHGLWEGLTWPEVVERFGEAAARRRYAEPWESREHSGESGADVWGRVRAAWEDLAERHAGQRVLVVTHATPMQLLVCHALGAPLASWPRVRVELGGLTRLDVAADGGVSLRAFNRRPWRWGR